MKDTNLEDRMSNTVELDAALKLALHLRPAERLRLVELVVASVSQEIAVASAQNTTGESTHWGKSLNQLLDQLDLSEWAALPTADSVEWVDSIRRQEQSRLEGFWKGEQ
jgi:hypothetical protein